MAIFDSVFFITTSVIPPHVVCVLESMEDNSWKIGNRRGGLKLSA